MTCFFFGVNFQNQVQKEIITTVTSIPFMSIPTVFMFFLEVRGYSKLYDNVGDTKLGECLYIFVCLLYFPKRMMILLIHTWRRARRYICVSIVYCLGPRGWWYCWSTLSINRGCVFVCLLSCPKRMMILLIDTWCQAWRHLSVTSNNSFHFQ